MGAKVTSSMAPPLNDRRAPAEAGAFETGDAESKELWQAAWYYAANLSSYVLPLLTFTFLARVLGPVEWGRLSAFHSLGLYLSQIVEYGFNFAAARDVARYRRDRDMKRRILAEVHAAKLLIAAGVLLLAIPCYALLPGRLQSPVLFPLALAYAIAQGSTLLWYFQGDGRIAQLSLIEAVTRSVAAALTIILVRGPGNAWLMLALNTAACLGTTCGGLLLIRRDIPLTLASAQSGLSLLRTTFPLFLFRGAASMYSSANVFLFGLFGAPAAIGYYAGAERAYKGLTAFLHPLMQLMYARVNYSLGRSAEAGRNTLRQSAFMTILAGLLLGLGCVVAAPLIVSILLGPAFTASIPVVRIFGAVLIAEAVSIAFGVQWMLPLGFDKQLTAITLAAGVINVLCACFVAPRFGAIGMAAAVLLTNSALALGCITFLRWRGFQPPAPDGPA
ncbi:MAG: oligosaccharide flippase family protein [Bryobacterales bacterium]|nr:oligosaccharide flippase family protein [Bryobacterales bacterium]